MFSHGGSGGQKNLTESNSGGQLDFFKMDVASLHAEGEKEKSG